MIQVRNPHDLLELRQRYLDLFRSGSECLLEVEVADGAYDDVAWELEPPQVSATESAAPSIDIVIRGAPAVLPLPGGIAARNLRCERIIFSQTDRIVPSRIEVARGLTLKSCLVADCQWSSSHHPGPLLWIRARGTALGRPSPVEVSIEDCWFANNRSEPRVTLLGFESHAHARGFFDRLDIRRSAFLDGTFATDLRIEHARQVLIEDSLFWKPAAVEAILVCQTTGAVAVKRSTFVVEDADQVAQVRGCPPVDMKESQIYARGWSAGDRPPEALDIAATDILDRAQLGAGKEAAAVAAKLPTGELPGTAVKEQLAKAFGLRWPSDSSD